MTDSHAVFKSSDAGLLLVFMEPGPQVSLSEFHEWYDSEHVPLRIQRFASFRSATRYAVTSTELTPSLPTEQVPIPPPSSWGAFYTISNNDTFAHVSYTSLRTQRSAREAELFTRLSIIDRRIYRLEYDSDLDANISVPRIKLALDVQTEADTPLYIVANSVDMQPSAKHEYDDWFENEHVPMLSKVPGWRRSRRFTLIDNGVNGKDARPGMHEGVPKCLGLHEWDEAPEQKAEYKQACNTAWRRTVLGDSDQNLIRRERKTCTLYRSWDPIAAIHAQAKQH